MKSVDQIIDNAKAGVGLQATEVLDLIKYYEKQVSDLLKTVKIELEEEPEEPLFEEE